MSIQGDEDEHLIYQWKMMLLPSTQTQRCLAVVIETQIVLEYIHGLTTAVAVLFGLI